MKIKKEKTLGSRRVVTYVLSQKDAYQVHEAARFLKGNEWLVPYAYETKGKGYRVHFDVTGLVSLSTFLSRPLFTAQLVELLHGVELFLNARPELGMPLRDVRFLPSEVYVNSFDGHLKFVLMPVSCAGANSHDAYELIYFIVQRAIVNDSAEQGCVREQVLRFLSVPELFSVTEFRKFIATLQGKKSGEERRSVLPSNPTSIPEDSFADLLREDQVADLTLPDGKIHSVALATIVRQETGECISLTVFPVQMGSSVSNDYVIAGNDAISKKHAMLKHCENGFCIADLHSTNGTWVAGQRLAPETEKELLPGQTFMLANESFMFLA